MTGPALALSADLATSLATPPDTRDIELRHGMLKQMGCPARCLHAMLEGYEDSSIASRLGGKSLVVGSAVHSLLLGGPLVVECPHKRGTKAHDKFAEDHPGAILLTRGEYKRATGMANAVKRDRHASQVLFAPDSIYEATIHWEWLGRKRRSTPDVRSFSHLVELKTTQKAGPDDFKWAVRRYCYHAQLADQANAIEYATGRRPRDIYICAVESTPPYVPVVYRLTENDIEQGERLNRAWMERFAICEATNQWPGYAQAIVDLDLPSGDDDSVFPDDDGEEVVDEGDRSDG